MRFVRRHAAELAVDGGLVALWGDSAGGYLAALAGLAGGSFVRPDGDDIGSVPVLAVIDRFGLSDLSDVGADFDTASRELLREAANFPASYLHGAGTDLAADADPAVTRRADPASYVSASSPAFLFLHGDDDRVVSPSQTLRLHERLRAAGGRSRRVVLAGAGHGDLGPDPGPAAATGWHSTTVVEEMVAFLGQHLRRDGPPPAGAEHAVAEQVQDHQRAGDAQ